MVEAPARSNTLDLASARERLGEIVADLRRGADRVVIETDGEEAAAIVSSGDLRRLRQYDAQRLKAIEGMRQISAAFADVPVPELERQVELALAEVRADMRAERNATKFR